MAVTDMLCRLYDNITPFHVALSISAVLFYLAYVYLKNRDLPPGPRGVPILGYWPFLNDETCHIQLKNMGQKYGDVFSFTSAGKLFIHLGSIKATKEVMVTKSECFAGRSTDYSLLNTLFGEGVITANGEPWKILRKYFLAKFKEHGLNAVKENVTSSLYDCLKEMVDDLHNSKEEPVAITDLAMDKCMLNMRRILFNDQGITMEELREMINQYGNIANNLRSPSFLLVGNISRFLILPFMPGFWRMKRSNHRIAEILKHVVDRHKKNYDETQVIDIIDCYIKERDERRKKGDPTAIYFTDKALASSLHQFVNDGVLFVGYFIGVFLTTLVEHPDVQEKVYEELMEVVGSQRLPTMEDKNKLPYTNAFMYEVMRKSDFFPLIPSLECTKETTVQGFRIPKGAIMVLNMYASHHNPNTYDDPDTFNPSRYLPSADKQRPDLPIMFGVGKRSCIGEGFTMIQAFMSVTTIAMTFRLTYPEGAEDSSNVWWKEKALIRAIPRNPK